MWQSLYDSNHLRPLKSRPQDEASKSLLVDLFAAVCELDHTGGGRFRSWPLSVVYAKIKLGARRALARIGRPVTARKSWTLQREFLSI